MTFFWMLFWLFQTHKWENLENTYYIRGEYPYFLEEYPHYLWEYPHFLDRDILKYLGKCFWFKRGITPHPPFGRNTHTFVCLYMQYD